jgi:polyisoprenoid-binding protein YceI
MKKVLSIFLFALVSFSATAVFAQTTYESDPAHTTVLFRVKHVDIAYVYGQFLKSEGTVTVDKDDISTLKTEWTVQAESVFTNNKKRDDHLKSPDFLNVKQFPTITFKSKKTEKIGDTTVRITGDVTLHGKTKEITFLGEMTGHGKGPQGKERIGFFASFDINRKDFGVKGVGATDDRVHMIVTFEGIAK